MLTGSFEREADVMTSYNYQSAITATATATARVFNA